MSGTSGRWFVACLVGSFCNLYIVNTSKEQNAGVSMVQKRRQPAWKTENQRKRSKKIARKRRRVIAYTVRGIMAAVLAVMILLMICGCLYIRDFFRRNENESSTQKADVVRETISGVEEDELDADLSGEENHMVVLDAGHGGEDGGTVEQAATEKAINLAVVLKLKELLEEQGIRVVLTRDKDIFMKLEERVQIVNGEKADLFISIHCNYYEKDSSIYGLECYYCKSGEEGKHYAEKIMETIKESENIVSRNVKPADYYILKNTKVPAVLVEIGYLSNYNERNQLMSEEYQEKLAGELVKGIVKGLEEKTG
ncbi:N-acetylmuramoyl-L-alanine amidase [Clostridiaceae bacterium]|nr:N-acetylmuramoyl-L-alanine amidase [Clostridiaceae bacterium]